MGRYFLRAPLSPTLDVSVWLSADREMTPEELAQLLAYLTLAQAHQERFRCDEAPRDG